ncbi:hypothetical protein NPIL_552011 [Nephila pilipes]|uniref:Uncharacterized protein n=1 Tax=Nephila pilipes TaxID=299642 RepID=A0A8X6QY21_NEPPI|nr:hypothetical protein NPIL_552011 [Nephila pilipes]
MEKKLSSAQNKCGNQLDYEHGPIEYLECFSNMLLLSLAQLTTFLENSSSLFLVNSKGYVIDDVIHHIASATTASLRALLQRGCGLTS